MIPVRFQFCSMGKDPAKLAPNTAAAEALGVPLVQHCEPHQRTLAICGSGPSIKAHLKRLRAWKGDIWAINGTVGYLLEHGINSVFVSVDPGTFPDMNRIKGGTSALLATCCEPAVFDLYPNKVKTFYISENERAPFVVGGGCSTATRAPELAVQMGYRTIVFFGCEGSYSEDTHAYGDFKGKEHIWILAGGRRYRTNPGHLMQCQYLSDLIMKFPQGFSEKSGGLLRAMITHSDSWTMTHVSDALKTKLEASFIRQGAQL